MVKKFVLSLVGCACAVVVFAGGLYAANQLLDTPAIHAEAPATTGQGR